MESPDSVLWLLPDVLAFTEPEDSPADVDAGAWFVELWLSPVDEAVCDGAAALGADAGAEAGAAAGAGAVST